VNLVNQVNLSFGFKSVSPAGSWIGQFSHSRFRPERGSHVHEVHGIVSAQGIYLGGEALP